MDKRDFDRLQENLIEPAAPVKGAFSCDKTGREGGQYQGARCNPIIAEGDEAIARDETQQPVNRQPGKYGGQ